MPATRLGDCQAYGPKCPPSFNLLRNSDVGIAGSVTMFTVPREPRLADQMKLVASDVSVAVLKDTGHWLLEERPDETIEALQNFSLMQKLVRTQRSTKWTRLSP